MRRLGLLAGIALVSMAAPGSGVAVARSPSNSKVSIARAAAVTRAFAAQGIPLEQESRLMAAHGTNGLAQAPVEPEGGLRSGCHLRPWFSRRPPSEEASRSRACGDRLRGLPHELSNAEVAERCRHVHRVLQLEPFGSPCDQPHVSRFRGGHAKPWSLGELRDHLIEQAAPRFLHRAGRCRIAPSSNASRSRQNDSERAVNVDSRWRVNVPDVNLVAAQVLEREPRSPRRSCR